MISRLVLAGAIACLGAGGVALAQDHGAGTHSQRAPQQVYAETCGYCHGVNVGPIIRGRNLPPALTKSFVRMGPNSMPAFRQTEITDDELDALAVWLQQSETDPEERGE